MNNDNKRFWDDFRATDFTDVTCSKCGSIQNKKVNSIRVNIKRNGDYICHKCKVHQNKEATAEKLRNNRNKDLTPRSFDDYDAKCDDCHAIVSVKYKNYKANLRRNNGSYRCKSCSLKSAHKDGKFDNIYTNEFRDKLLKNSSDFWSNQDRDEWAEKFRTDNHRAKMSECGKKPWVDPDYREKMIKQNIDNWKNDDFRKKVLGKFYDLTEDERKARKAYHGEVYRSQRDPRKFLKSKITTSRSDSNRNGRVKEFDVDIDYIMDLWNSSMGKCAVTGLQMIPKTKSLYSASIDRVDSKKGYIRGNVQLVCKFVNLGKESHPQDECNKFVNCLRGIDEVYFDVLDEDLRDFVDLNLKLILMHRVSKIDNFDFDADSIVKLFYEQGGRCAISGLPMNTINSPFCLSIDRIDNDVGYEFGNIRLVCQFINLGSGVHSDDEVLEILDDIRNYEPEVGLIDLVDFNFGDVYISRISADDARSVVERFHYLGNIGTGGVYIGAFLNDMLIGVCIFSHVQRMSIAERLDCDYDKILELSRFCIIPEYQKRNFASWFISRCVRFIKSERAGLRFLVSFADSTSGHIGTIYRASNWRFDGMVPPSATYYVDGGGVKLHKNTLWKKAKSRGLTESQFAFEHGFEKVWGGEKYRYVWEY